MPTNLICSEPVAEESEMRSWDMASPENAAAFLRMGPLNLSSLKLQTSVWALALWTNWYPKNKSPPMIKHGKVTPPRFSSNNIH
jgi:hypothetical protein